MRKNREKGKGMGIRQWGRHGMKIFFFFFGSLYAKSTNQRILTIEINPTTKKQFQCIKKNSCKTRQNLGGIPVFFPYGRCATLYDNHRVDPKSRRVDSGELQLVPAGNLFHDQLHYPLVRRSSTTIFILITEPPEEIQWYQGITL